MPLSSALAPGFIRLRYTGSTIPHNQVIPINFAGTPTPGVDPSLDTTGGTPVDFSAAILDFVDNVYAASFSADTSFGFAEIYSVDPTTGVRQFIYSVNLNEVGESADPQVGLVGGLFVFKTTAGKFLKVAVMEGVYTADVRNIGTVPADGRQDMIDYILGPTNIFYGRQNAWPLAFMSFTSKEYDVLRKRALGPLI